jgi:hypothetical protein
MSKKVRVSFFMIFKFELFAPNLALRSHYQRLNLVKGDFRLVNSF